MVELQDVSFSYTKEVGTLTHIDLTIRPGECVLLCGASGCGKTTITKLVNGLIPAFTEDCGAGTTSLPAGPAGGVCFPEPQKSVFQHGFRQ